MKTTNYIVLCSIILCLQACSKGYNDPSNEVNASLQINIAGTATHTKATAPSLPSEEDKINTLAVGIFNADGTTNVIAEPTLSGTAVSKINCNPGNCDIIVVANAPSGVFIGVTNKTEFLNRTISLDCTTSEGKQLSNNLPMSGETDGVTLKVGLIAQATVNLSRLVAKVSVNSIKTAFDSKGQYANATFKTDRIFLYNACGRSKTATNDQTMPDAPTWLSGGVVNNGVWEKETEYLLDELSTAQSTVPTPYWFYTFSNTTNGRPTKLVISGFFDADGPGVNYGERRVYYPIIVNKAQTGTDITGSGGGTSTVLRNRDYAITATIKGVGVESPEDNMEPVNVQLSVTVADWELSFLQDVVIY